MRKSSILVLTLVVSLSTFTLHAEDAEPKFKPLFNGQNLDGWVGDVDGYDVIDGAIVCNPKKGGNLYTKEEFSDFVLKFEFKLPAGANNGLGIRAPLSGNAAYAGMELQVLDNTHPRYAKLKPYQYHGSLYGLVPAKRGHLKPVGEWNEQEVTLQGDRLEVILNGTSILKADLKKLREVPTPDGQKHPGLENKTGHIGFLGHGAAVEFRNLMIMRLNPPAAN